MASFMGTFSMFLVLLTICGSSLGCCKRRCWCSVEYIDPANVVRKTHAKIAERTYGSNGWLSKGGCTDARKHCHEFCLQSAKNFLNNRLGSVAIDETICKVEVGKDLPPTNRWQIRSKSEHDCGAPSYNYVGMYRTGLCCWKCTLPGGYGTLHLLNPGCTQPSKPAFCQ